jgi:hypothetical protein
MINNLKFRDNFVMIGQKGLKAGFAVEKVNCSGCAYTFEMPVVAVTLALTIYMSSVSYSSTSFVISCQSLKTKTQFRLLGDSAV